MFRSGVGWRPAYATANLNEYLLGAADRPQDLAGRPGN
jgi:hypothetical protein